MSRRRLLFLAAAPLLLASCHSEPSSTPRYTPAQLQARLVTAAQVGLHGRADVEPDPPADAHQVFAVESLPGPGNREFYVSLFYDDRSFTGLPPLTADLQVERADLDVAGFHRAPIAIGTNASATSGRDRKYHVTEYDIDLIADSVAIQVRLTSESRHPDPVTAALRALTARVARAQAARLR